MLFQTVSDSYVGVILSVIGAATVSFLISTVILPASGMGSSAMGATVLRNKIKKAGIDGVSVTYKAIANLDGNEDLIVTHRDLTARALILLLGSLPAEELTREVRGLTPKDALFAEVVRVVRSVQSGLAGLAKRGVLPYD